MEGMVADVTLRARDDLRPETDEVLGLDPVGDLDFRTDWFLRPQDYRWPSPFHYRRAQSGVVFDAGVAPGQLFILRSALTGIAFEGFAEGHRHIPRTAFTTLTFAPNVAGEKVYIRAALTTVTFVAFAAGNITLHQRSAITTLTFVPTADGATEGYGWGQDWWWAA